MVLEEEEITEEILLKAIKELYQNRQTYIDAMSSGEEKDSITQIVNLIEDCAKTSR